MSTQVASLLLTLLCGTEAVPAVGESDCAEDPATTLARVRTLRLEGELADAIRLANETFRCGQLDTASRIRLHLEFARVHDRVGLHRNSRPVAAAAEEIDRAAALSRSAEGVLGGEVELARAYDRYRAETGASGFPAARRHLRAAIEKFSTAEDHHRHADAVHLLGLVEMQTGALDQAMELFERSRVLDERGGARQLFLGDYHRHVAFVAGRRGDAEIALAHFERSYAHRMAAGATDASLYAAASLGSALVGLGRPAEAREPLVYALLVAVRLDSPRGVATAAGALGRMLEAMGEPVGAVAAYRLAEERARAVGLEDAAARAAESVDRLGDRTRDGGLRPWKVGLHLEP